MWSPWARAAPVANPGLEAAATVAFSFSQTLKGGRLKVIYLAERACCQLPGMDTPWVPMDPLVFMLAPRSMTDAKYSQWRPSIPFTDQVIDESNYEEFNGTHLMPSLIVPIFVLAPLIFQ